jgi:hypothetical protein
MISPVRVVRKAAGQILRAAALHVAPQPASRASATARTAAHPRSRPRSCDGGRRRGRHGNPTDRTIAGLLASPRLVGYEQRLEVVPQPEILGDRECRIDSLNLGRGPSSNS